MTFERKLLVGLEEIRAIVFECIKPSETGGCECKSRIVLRPENVGSVPKECPRGHAWDWNVPVENAAFISALPQFVDSLKKLRQAGREQQAGFRIFLEFDEPSEAE